ncbi:MAG: MBL fold metallo-hydrolase [Magnetococcales bacterium]|nr:MBL fold metallo-hydrolase [Magnetococcales bacterium]
MKIVFRGVRGSIPSPGARTVRYGGNTTCIEVRSDNGELIILDAGSGIFPLANTLLASLPITCHIFITHTHWDHIQGLPFFIPVFIPGNCVKIHGAFDPVNHRSIREVLARQMEYSYFPVREEELNATMEYTTLRERQTIEVGDAKVTNILMNHPVLNFGYKVECNGKSVFFTGDHEWPLNIYPDDAENQNEMDRLNFLEYQSFIDERNQELMDFIHGVDAFIIDSAYTDEEYFNGKVGWGHGTFENSIKLARRAEAKALYFTHHEPTRSDEDLEKLLASLHERFPPTEHDPKWILAREGVEIEL